MDAIYLRVSTRKQKESGLGIDAQRAAIAAAGITGAEFIDYESGDEDERPELEKALRYVRKSGGTLYIAKLDRLSRRQSFLFYLRDRMMSGGAKFAAVDQPEFTTLTLGIYAAIAQHERELIAERSKAARARAVLKHGGEWAKGDATRFADKSGAAANREKSLKRKKQVFAQAKLLREKGLKLHEIAEQLNLLKFDTPSQLAYRRKGAKGDQWTKGQVSRLLSSFDGVDLTAFLSK